MSWETELKDKICKEIMENLEIDLITDEDHDCGGELVNLIVRLEYNNQTISESAISYYK